MTRPDRQRRCPACGTVFTDDVVFCGHDGTITIEVQDPADTDPRLGQRLGDYLVVARIADGAMGRVFEGRHFETKARVAIKVLHADVARDKVAVERFKREYDSARELDHPYVVHVIDFGQTPDGSHFLTMEYLKGEELGERMHREGAFSVARTVRIAAQTAMAIEHAHGFGFVHRDLKPGNIFLVDSPEGEIVKLLDFGSVKLQMEVGAKLTAFGTTLGSPYYMSPEQAMGKDDIDGRTDSYALMAIFYEMLTGKIAFEGGTVAQILMKILNESAPPPSTVRPGLPASLDDVVDRALRKNKAERYASPTEMTNALVAAFGVNATTQEVATMPTSQFESLLQAATPRSPAPFQQGSGNAPHPGTSTNPNVQRGPRLQPPESEAQRQAHVETWKPEAALQTNTTKLILIGVAGIGCLIVLAVAAFLFL